MSTATAAPPTLVCNECQHVNEAERIYCHACGARLDRSALTAGKGGKTEAPEEVQKRLAGMFNKRGVKLHIFTTRAVKLLLAAIGAAGLLQILRAPDLPAVGKADAFPPQINMDLETMQQYHRPPALTYSEEAVNGYLGNALKNKKEKLGLPLIDFERGMVALNEGQCRVILERSIFGYSIFTSGDYVLQTGGGKLNLETRGGAIGRLPIHPQLMKYAGFLFSDVTAALERERKLITHAGGVAFHDKQVVFTLASQ